MAFVALTSLAILLVTVSVRSVLASQAPAQGTAGAQQTFGERPATIQTTSEEVLLDLVARDKHGRAVRDLRADQVEVFEDGVRQQVTSFRLVEGEVPLTPEGRKPAHPDLVRQINLVTLVFERLGDEGRKLARRAALDFLKTELRPNVFVAVFSNDQRIYVWQQFTNDRRLLEQAVEQAAVASSAQLASRSASVIRQLERATEQAETANLATSGIANAERPGAEAGAGFAEAKMAQMTVDMLRYSEMLSREHEGRSSLYSLLAVVRAQQRLLGRKTIIYFCEGLFVTPSLVDLFRSAVSEANRSNVSIYSVDARGLTTSEVSGAARELLMGAESATRGGAWPGRGELTSGQTKIAGESAVEAWARANAQDTLADLSVSTGGFLTANTNEMNAAMRRIADDIRGYYELSYRPPTRGYDGKFHRISVKVLRPGITLQTRSGYFALPPVAGPPLLPYEMAMLSALDSTSAPEGFDYRVQAFHFGYSTQGMQHQLVMEVPLANLAYSADAKRQVYRLHFSLMARVKDPEGRPVYRFSEDYPLQGPQVKMETLRKQDMIFTRNFQLTPGRYTLEAVAMDRETGKTAIRRSVLVVPPPTGLTLSSVSIVRHINPLPAAEPDNNDPLRFQSMRIVPNLGEPIRQSTTTGVSLYFVVYPSAQAAEKPRMELDLFRGGQLIASTPVHLLPPDLTGRSCYLGTIPTEKFEPGRYEIRVSARQGVATAEEHAFFSVEP